MGEFLRQLMETLLAWVPRLAHIRSTHGGVKFTGSRASAWGPGLHWWWPLTSTYAELPTVAQAHNLATQIVLGSGPQAVAASGVIVYRVDDVLKAVTSCEELDDIVSNVGLAAVFEVLATKKLPDLRAWAESGELTNRLTRKVRSRLRAYGLYVERCGLTDLAPAKPLYLMGEAAGATALPVPE